MTKTEWQKQIMRVILLKPTRQCTVHTLASKLFLKIRKGWEIDSFLQCNKMRAGEHEIRIRIVKKLETKISGPNFNGK